MQRRSLRKLPDFLAHVQDASQRAPRLPEAIAGAEFVILRSPEQGMPVRETRFRSWPVHPESGMTFKIIYSFDDREIVFRALYVAVPPPGY
jgi:hypothetical protein